ncbi:MAG: bacteriohemerythrin [Actinomycetota bacterium]
MAPVAAETGVREIDAGNEGLSYLLARVFDVGVECRRGRSGACDFRECTKISAILRYVGRHFAGQEAVMAEADYPAGGEHSRDHAALVHGLAAMQDACVCAERERSRVRAFIAEWHADHFVRCDRPLGRWAITRRVLQPVR